MKRRLDDRLPASPFGQYASVKSAHNDGTKTGVRSEDSYEPKLGKLRIRAAPSFLNLT